ncbi:MAG: CidA/LrgA family holin-like protein [Desulfitobacterium sp.]|nr:CidA/LrgA family holin-like protein [Desulfitobacterium sp.]
MKRTLITIGQIFVLMLISLCVNKIIHIFNLNIPGSILGIIVVFLLLQFKIIPLKWIESGGNFLLTHLMLFLIPSAVGIIQHGNILRSDGLSLFAVIIFGSIIAMVVTGLFAEKFFESKRKEQGSV